MTTLSKAEVLHYLEILSKYAGVLRSVSLDKEQADLAVQFNETVVGTARLRSRLEVPGNVWLV